MLKKLYIISLKVQAISFITPSDNQLTDKITQQVETELEIREIKTCL